MSIITNFEQFQKFLDSSSFNDTAFSRLNDSDMSFFKVQLSFSEDGFPSGYWGDIVKNEDMSDSELGDFVSSIFGVDKDRFLKRYHYFGTMEGTCTSRPYFNCPY